MLIALDEKDELPTVYKSSHSFLRWVTFLVSKIDYFQVRSVIQSVSSFSMSRGEESYRNTDLLVVQRTGHTGSNYCVGPSSRFHKQQNGVKEKHNANNVLFDS